MILFLLEKNIYIYIFHHLLTKGRETYSFKFIGFFPQLLEGLFAQDFTQDSEESKQFLHFSPSSASYKPRTNLGESGVCVCVCVCVIIIV